MQAILFAPVIMVIAIAHVRKTQPVKYPYKDSRAGVDFLAISILLLFGAAVLRGQPTDVFGWIYALLLISAVIVSIDGACVDIQYKEIPHATWISIALLGLLASAVSEKGILPALFSVGVIFGIFLLLASFGGSMGGGDVKLAGAIGFFIPPDLILPFLITAFGAGSTVGLYQIVVKKKAGDFHLAFGPYISGAFAGIALYLCAKGGL